MLDLDGLKVVQFVLLNRNKATGSSDERFIWETAAVVALNEVEAAILLESEKDKQPYADWEDKHVEPVPSL